MGVLSLPRLYFRGFNYWTPSTFNNDDYDPPIDTYDVTTAKLNWSYLNSLGIYTDEQFKKWATVAIPYDTPKNKVPPAEWGYYGGNQCGFVTRDEPMIHDPDFSKPADVTHVTGYTDTRGEYVDKGDPWLDQPLQFNPGAPSKAKLVDVNPQAFWSSQIFAESFLLGTGEHGFSAPVAHRMYSRWINLLHNYDVTGQQIITGPISAVWQTCFAKDEITFFGGGSRFEAEARKAFKNRDVLGFMLRFTNYDTIYFEGKAFDELKKKYPGDLFPLMEKIARLYQEYVEKLEAYRDGRTTERPPAPVNSAYSRVVGWIGLWCRGELASMPGGRLLAPGLEAVGGAETPTLLVAARGLPESFYQKSSGAPFGYPARVPLGPAAVEVETRGGDVERLAVDLGGTLPEADNQGKKADLGVVQLALELPGQDEPLPIAELPNDQASYEKTSGVVDVSASQLLNPVTAKQIRSHPLVLTVESMVASESGSGEPTWTKERVVGLAESPVTAQTDERGLYVNEPDPPWPSRDDSASAVFQVRRLGEPAGGGKLRLAVAQYDAGWNLVQEGATDSRPLVEITVGGETFLISKVVDVPRNGKLELSVRALRPGVPNIALFPVGSHDKSYEPPASISSFAVTSLFYTSIRCLPFHNQLAASFEGFLETEPDVQQVNEKVFDEVFQTYYLLYPIMGFISDPLKFQEWRGRIRALTDPALFEASRFMPVTRALSAGQRRIIERYCDYLDALPKRKLPSR